MWNAVGMSAYQVLSILCLLPGTLQSECGFYEFRCGSERTCINATLTCDGKSDCPQGTDEDPILCAKGDFRLPTGHVTVFVHYTQRMKSVQFMMCGRGLSCNTVQVFGAATHGRLWYRHGTVCPSPQCFPENWCEVKPVGAQPFPTSKLEFHVERNDSTMAMWLKGHENSIASTTFGSPRSTLHVRPEYWTENADFGFGIAEGCNYRNFSCDETKCIDASRTCDGQQDCSNGADESESLCSQGTLNIRNGHMKVYLHSKPEYGALEFSACTLLECSGKIVINAVQSGQLFHETFVECNRWGAKCTPFAVGLPALRYPRWPDAPLAFKVDLSATALRVWLRGNKSTAVSVPTRASTLFRVRPQYWTGKTNPILFGTVEPCGLKFACPLGNCIDASWACDGINDCDDPADEADSLCQPYFKRLNEGPVHVKVDYEVEMQGMVFTACNATSCSKVEVYGSFKDGTLFYKFIANCNSRAGNCASEVDGKPSQPYTPWTDGALMFVVDRRDDEVLVWLEGRRDQLISMPAGADKVLLFAKPRYWGPEQRISFN